MNLKEIASTIIPERNCIHYNELKFTAIEVLAFLVVIRSLQNKLDENVFTFSNYFKFKLRPITFLDPERDCINTATLTEFLIYSYITGKMCPS